MKKFIVAILVFVEVVIANSIQDTNTTTKVLSDSNTTTQIVKSVDTNSTVQKKIVQIKPTITYINIDIKDKKEKFLEGNATKNLEVDVVLIYDKEQRIPLQTITDNNGLWHMYGKDLGLELNDGTYDIYVSTKDAQGNKSEVISKKALQRDTTINGSINFTDKLINQANISDVEVVGKIDLDSKVIKVSLGLKGSDKTIELQNISKVLDKATGTIKIPSGSLGLDKLPDGNIVINITIKDNHNNKKTIQAFVVKDTTSPKKPIVIKSVKDGNMVYGQADNMLVYLGTAEVDSKVKVVLYNIKEPKKTTSATVLTAKSGQWTVSGKDFDIKSLKNGTIVSKIIQIDKAGNSSKELVLKTIKEKNPIFPKTVELIDSKDYMSVATLKDIDDKVKALAVSDKYIIAGSLEFIYYFGKKYGKLQKKVEIKDRWIEGLLIVNNTLIVALDDGRVEIRDLNSGKLQKKFIAHKMPVLSLAYDSKNNILITTSASGDIKIWDFKTLKLLYNLHQHQWDVLSVVVDDGLLYSSSDDYSIKIWDIKSGKLIKNLKSAQNGTINSLAIYQNYLISASDDKTIDIRDKKTGELIKVLKGHRKGVTVLKVNHDTLISASKDRTIILWDLKTFEQQKQLRGHTKAILSLVVNDENIISGAMDYRVKVWGYDPSLEGLGDIDETLLAKYDLIKSVLVSNDTITSLAQTENEIVFGTYGYIFFYNNVTYKYTRSYTTLDKVIVPTKKKDKKDTTEDEWADDEETTSTSADDDGWSTDGDDEDEEAQDWETIIQQKKAKMAKLAKNQLQWVNDIEIRGNILTTALGNSLIKIWDLDKNQAIAVLEGHEASVESLNRADSALVTSSSDGKVKIWDDETHELITSIDAHQWDIRDTVCDETKLYTVSDDYSIKIWDIESGDLIDTIKAAHDGDITSILLYQDTIITSSKDGTIKYRDKNTGNLLKVLKGHKAGVNVLIRDDEHLISGSDDTTIKVWDIKTGKLLKTLEGGHTKAITALLITDDYIISGSKDKKISIWKYYE